MGAGFVDFEIFGMEAAILKAKAELIGGPSVSRLILYVATGGAIGIGG